MTQADTPAFNREIYFDHQAVSVFDEVASLFNLRQVRSRQLLTARPEVLSLDARIRAMLKYLVLQKHAVQALTVELIEQVEQQDIGYEADAFTAALAAFSSEDRKWIAQVTNRLLPHEECRQGLAYALAWLPSSLSHNWIAAFLDSKDLGHKWLAARVCSLRNVFPRKKIAALLQRQDCQHDDNLLAQLLFLTGQMKATEALPTVIDATTSQNRAVQCNAFWAALLTGATSEPRIKSEILPFSLTSNEAFHQLSPWLIAAMSFTESQQYLSVVMRENTLAMDVKIKAIAAHGDPAVVSWLLHNIRQPGLQPWLGLAFFQISGVDIAPYSMKSPVDFEDEEETDALFLDQDNSLPYPDREQLATLWQRIGSGYSARQRLFLGRPVNPQSPTAWREKYEALHLVQKTIAVQQAVFDKTVPYRYFVMPQPE